MACSDVKLACCRLCNKPLASNLGTCIHCGVANPIEEKTCNWLHRVLFALLIIGAILATIRYNDGQQTRSDCRWEERGQRRDC